MAREKTWLDLLGRSARCCRVDGRRIVRQETADKFKVIWSFGTHGEAKGAMRAWLGEIASVCARRCVGCGQNADHYCPECGKPTCSRAVGFCGHVGGVCSICVAERLQNLSS